MEVKRTDCVGVVCIRGDEVLLIQRGTAPRKGEWSIPGGRIETGETEAQACLRELSEETAVTAQLLTKITALDADFEGFHTACMIISRAGHRASLKPEMMQIWRASYPYPKSPRSACGRKPFALLRRGMKKWLCFRSRRPKLKP